MRTLFISDLHLDPARPDIQNCFTQFVQSCLTDSQSDNRSIDAIYILGDLFEVWIGDDASIPLYQQTINQLKQLTEHGIKIYVMHGNRDFLMGAEFEQASGCTLIPDLYHLTLKHSEQTILLSHGDIFCTDDTEYQQFKNLVRNPQWQQEFLGKSIDERIQIAKSMREQSKLRGKEKKTEIMDVNQHSVEAIMSEHRATILIHGHTHRPATHRFELNKQSAQRIVLPDWDPDAEVFELP